MRYELKNVSATPFFCVEAAKLVKPGESIRVNRLDEGTRLLAEGEKPRLAIVDRMATPPPAPPVATALDGKAKDAPKSARAAADAKSADAKATESTQSTPSSK